MCFFFWHACGYYLAIDFMNLSKDLLDFGVAGCFVLISHCSNPDGVSLTLATLGSLITKYSNFPNEKRSRIHPCLFCLAGCCYFHQGHPTRV